MPSVLELALENDLAGLAILGIEKIDLDRGGLLGHSMNSPGKESNTKNKNHHPSHYLPFMHIIV